MTQIPESTRRGIAGWIATVPRDQHDDEQRAVRRFLRDAARVLDVGCGTGALLSADPDRFVGVDSNPESVAVCEQRGCTAQVADARQLPFADGEFDAAACSHLVQRLPPSGVEALLSEMCRVVKPGGTIVIGTLNWLPTFFRDPESLRAYPPAAIRGFLAGEQDEGSPTSSRERALVETGLWLRHPPLRSLGTARRRRDDYVPRSTAGSTGSSCGSGGLTTPS